MTTARVDDSDRQETERTRRTYDRVAPFYDLQDWLPERVAFRRWRRRLWRQVPDGRVLEIGVGTGKNLSYYRPGHAVTAIDLSPRMLDRARARVRKDGLAVDLRLMDAQTLEFDEASFDSVVSTFVFCSVPEPVIGLRQAQRVLKPGGRIYLLEHVLSEGQPLRWMMKRLNGLARSVSGANIDRDTAANVKAAGLTVAEVNNLWLDIVKLIVAAKD